MTAGQQPEAALQQPAAALQQPAAAPQQPSPPEGYLGTTARITSGPPPSWWSPARAGVADAPLLHRGRPWPTWLTWSSWSSAAP